MKLITIPDSLMDIVECFSTQNMWVRVQCILNFFFFDLLVSLSLFSILCTTGYMYLNLACVYVTNTAPCIISISLRVIYSLHAEYFFFSKILTETLSECQMVCIQIRTDVLLVLNWFQTICKCYQLTKKEWQI